MKLMLIMLLTTTLAYPMSTIVEVEDEPKEVKVKVEDPPPTPTPMPLLNTIVDDKHKKLRHLPMSREARPKSYTTPALQAALPGEIRYLHPSVSQVVNRSTLPEYQLESRIRRRERCRRGCACIALSLWGLITAGGSMLLYQCSNR